MNTLPGRWLAATLVAAGAAVAASPAPVPTGCRLEEGPNQLVRIYECQEKLRIATEAATKLSAIERNGRLVGLRVEGGAVLVERSGRRSAFQIVTAQAVTEVREASVAVDVKGDTTSVFVREGGVSVRQEGRTAGLRQGEGVDVASAAVPAPSPDGRPAPPRTSPGGGSKAKLEVKTWGAARVGALLGRLGRS